MAETKHTGNDDEYVPGMYSDPSIDVPDTADADAAVPRRDRSAQEAQLAEAQAALAKLNAALGGGTDTAAAPASSTPASGAPASTAAAATAAAAATTPASKTAAAASSKEKTGRFLNGRVVAWSFWDWGSAAFNAVIVTFVFSVYLTNAEMFGDRANTLYGWVTSAAGIVVAIIAPAVGQWTDRTGRRRIILNGGTLALVVVMALLYFVKPGMLVLGLFLIALGHVLFEVSEVIYNSMVGQVSNPGTVGRVSGFGWGMGYVGGIVLLIIIYVGFIAPEVGWFGVDTANGGGVRVAMLICAAWTLIFSIPIMLLVRDGEPNGTTSPGIIGAYKEVGRAIARLWRQDRSVVWFLLSAAVYRDGLAGVFAFGGVLAAAGFAFSAQEVMVFGIVANLVAGIATIIFGLLDDLWGARKVIIVSLISMLVFALIIFVFHTGGKPVFWVFGLGLCIFVGPVQSASRSYLSRITPEGEEGEIFGLYATCGRVVSFLAPFMYATAITFGAAKLGVSEAEAGHWGIIGIGLVLLLGLLMFLPVRAQKDDEKAA